MSIEFNKNEKTHRISNIDSGPGNLQFINGQVVSETIKILDETDVYLTELSINSYPGLPLSTVVYTENQSQSLMLWLVYTAKDLEFYEGKAEDSINLKMRNTVCNVNPSSVKYNLKLQGFNLSDVVIRCPYHIRSAEIEVTSDSIRHEVWEKESPGRLIGFESITLRVPVVMQFCPIEFGYFFDNQSLSCFKCPEDNYVLFSNTTNCREKTELMESVLGFKIKTKKGAQRWEEDLIEECTYKDRCVSSNYTKNYACHPSNLYTGPLCLDCAYQNSICKEGNRCGQCTIKNWGEFNLFLIFIFQLLVLCPLSIEMISRIEKM